MIEIIEEIAKKKGLKEKHIEMLKNLAKTYKDREILKDIMRMSLPKRYHSDPLDDFCITAYIMGLEDKYRDKKGLEPKWENIIL